MTTEQFYLSKEVQDMVNKNFDRYKAAQNHMGLGINGYYDFAYYTLEDNENLNLSISLTERKQEFLINSYYFLIIESTKLTKDGYSDSIATELAFEELKSIYKNLNKTVEIYP